MWKLPEAKCGQNNHPRKNLLGVIKDSKAITSAGKEDLSSELRKGVTAINEIKN